jgi:DNA-binding PadR family transcriptional regulator
MNVRTLCLGILSTREASGYEIKKEIEEGLFSNFIDASFGSIYPALTQLLGEELLNVRAEEQSGRPDKKVYAITSRGREALAKALMVVPARDKYKSEFLFEMLLQDYLPREHILKAIDTQLGHLRNDLGRIEECKACGSSHPGADFVAGYGHAILTAAVTYLEYKRAELVRDVAATAAE